MTRITNALPRLSARAVVADVNTYVDYTTDSRVIAAYKEVMAEISSLDEQWIAGVLARPIRMQPWGLYINQASKSAIFQRSLLPLPCPSSGNGPS